MIKNKDIPKLLFLLYLIQYVYGITLLFFGILWQIKKIPIISKHKSIIKKTTRLPTKAWVHHPPSKTLKNDKSINIMKKKIQKIDIITEAPIKWLWKSWRVDNNLIEKIVEYV